VKARLVTIDLKGSPMKIKNIVATLWKQDPLTLLLFMRDWRSVVRFHFLYAGLESGLLESLRTPCSKEELMGKLDVKRSELLEGLLEVGISLGELACKDGLYRVKGKRARSVVDSRGDAFAALVQGNLTYYNSVYRNVGARLRGAPLGHYLEEIGDLVARYSRLAEPFVHAFVRDMVAGKGSLRMLDVGCGSGAYLRAAVESNPNVTAVGIEVDEDVVEQARQNLASWGIGHRCTVIVADIRKPPADLTGSFDLITLFNIVYYFTLEERLDLLRALRGMLAPSGALAVVSSMRGAGQDLMAANLNLATSSMVGCTRLPDLDELSTQLMESGFDQIRQSRLMPSSAMYGVVARQGSPDT